jgi:hypothetical protein
MRIERFAGDTLCYEPEVRVGPPRSGYVTW